MFFGSCQRGIISNDSKFTFTFIKIFVIFRLERKKKHQIHVQSHRIVVLHCFEYRLANVFVAFQDYPRRLLASVVDNVCKQTKKKSKLIIHNLKYVNVHLTIRHFLITFDVFNIQCHSTYSTFETALMPELDDTKKKTFVCF